MKKIIKFFTLTAILLISSCEALQYELTEENFADIKNDIPDQNITITSFTDSLFIFGESTIKINIDLKGKEFERLNVFIDSEQYTGVVNQSSFAINTTKFSNGHHTLTLELLSHSGTNSLADRFEGEFIVFRKDYPLFIDNTIHAKTFGINNIDISNGLLRLQFDQYNNFNFQEYQVYKITVENNFIVEKLVKTIKQSPTNYWFDPDYIGGEVAYRVNLAAADKTLKGETRVYNLPAPKISKLVISDDNLAHIIWYKSPLFNSFSNYEIERVVGDTLNYTPETIQTISSVHDTLFINNDFGFGANIFYRINTKNSKDEKIYSKWNSVHLGYTISRNKKVNYINQLDSYFSWSYYGVTRFDSNLDEVAFLDKEEFEILADGSRAFVFRFNKVTEVDPLSFSEINSSITDDIVGYESVVYTNFAIAKPAKLFYTGFIYRSPTHYADAIYNLDVDNKSVLASIAYQSIPNSYIISCTNDGQYIAMGNEHGSIYKIRLATFKLVASFGSRKNFVFANDDNHFIQTTENNILVREIATTVSIEYPVEDLIYFPMIDSKTGYLGGYNYEKTYYYIYDITNGELKAKIKLLSESGYSDFYTSYSFANSTLFSTAGFYMKVQI